MKLERDRLRLKLVPKRERNFLTSVASRASEKSPSCLRISSFVRVWQVGSGPFAKTFHEVCSEL